jgi:zinc protease
MIGNIKGIPLIGGDFSEAPFASLASDVNRYVLDNGLVVLTREVYPSKVVFLSLWAKVGSANENDEDAGIAHFLEHMLFKTTKKRKVGQIAQEIHSLGGYLNGFTSYDCTAYWMVIPGRSFAKAIEIQYDAIYNPVFDSKEVEKERNVILEELKMYKDRPSDYLGEKVMSTAIQKHRYGKPIIGFEKTLENITTEKIQHFYRTQYRPNNCFLLAVGDIDSLDVVHKSERIFKKLREGNVDRNPSPKEPPQKKMRRVELTGEIMSAYLQMAFHIPSVYDRDIHAISLISTILGQGKSSRLYQVLREERKLVNDIFTYTYNQKDPCLLFVELELLPENIEKAEQAVFEVIEDLKENGITDKEFRRAKNLLEANYVYGQETVESHGRKIGYAENMGDYMLVEKFIQREMMVTKEEALESARNYLVSKNCTVGTYSPVT